MFVKDEFHDEDKTPNICSAKGFGPRPTLVSCVHYYAHWVHDVNNRSALFKVLNW